LNNLKAIIRKEKRDFFLRACSETVSFLDVQVNHITKDVGHINNKVLSKNGSKIGIFSVSQTLSARFFLFLLQI